MVQLREKKPKKKTKSGNQINKHKAKEGRHSCYLPSARFVDGKLRPRSWVGPSIKNAYLANQIRRWGMQPAQRCFGKNKVALSQIWLLCCFTLKKTLSSDSKRTAFDSIDHRDCSNRKFSLKRSHLRHDSVKIFKVTTLSKQRKDTLVLIFSSFGFIYSENSFGSAVVAKRHVPTSLPLRRRSRFPFPAFTTMGRITFHIITFVLLLSCIDVFGKPALNGKWNEDRVLTTKMNIFVFVSLINEKSERISLPYFKRFYSTFQT